MNEALRGSGRTTRLVETACKAAYVGRAVYILTAGTEHAKYLEPMIERTWDAMRGQGGHGIKVESMQHWDKHQQWDWDNMKPAYHGAHPNCLFLVEHFAVEQRLQQIHADIKYLATLAGKLYPHTV